MRIDSLYGFSFASPSRRIKRVHVKEKEETQSNSILYKASFKEDIEVELSFPYVFLIVRIHIYDCVRKTLMM